MGAYALLRGSGEARLAGAYYALGNGLTWILLLLRPGGFAAVTTLPHYQMIDLFLQISDVLMFGILMLRSHRYWTLVLCSLAICETATAWAGDLMPAVTWAYRTAQIIWFYSIISVIIYAVVTSTTVLKGVESVDTAQNQSPLLVEPIVDR